MGFRLFINNEEVDLLPNTRIAFTFQVNDLAELKDRQGSFSNQFEIPSTRKNIRICGHLNSAYSSDRSRWKRLPARAEDEGGTIVSNGYVALSSVESSIKMVLYAGALDLFGKIGEKLITQLDLAYLRHLWNAINAVATYNDETLPYLYPPVDYGNTIPGLNLDIEKLGMWVRSEFIANKIIEEAGYSLEGNILLEDDYRDLYVFAHKPEYDQKLFPGKIRVSDADSLTTLWAHIPTIGHAPRFGTIEDPFSLTPIPGTQFNDIITIPLSPFLPGLTQDFSGIVFKAPGTYTIEADIRFNMQYGLLVNHKPLIESNFMLVPGFDFLTNGVSQASFQPDNGTGIVDPLGIYMQPPLGEERKNILRFQVTALAQDQLIYFSNDIGGVLNGEPIIMSNKSYIRIVEIKDAPLQAGSWIDVATNLPELSQATFLKMLAQLFALVFDVNITTKVCTLVQFGELYANKGVAKDWSGKIVNANKLKQEWRSPYAKKNYLRFSNKNDVATTRGEGFFTIEDEMLPDEKEMFKIPFAQSELFEHVSGIRTITFPGYNSTDFKFEDDPGVRLAFIKRDGTTLALQVNSIPVGPLAGGPAYPQVWCIDLEKRSSNLDFDLYLLGKYYPHIAVMLKSYLKITGDFYLKPIDLYQFNHFIPIYISQFSAYFYPNKILSYVPGAPVKVELIRM